MVKSPVMLIKYFNFSTIRVVRCSKFERIREYHFLTLIIYVIVTDSERRYREGNMKKNLSRNKRGENANIQVSVV